MKLRAWLRPVALLGAFVLLVAACGSDAASEQPSDEDPTTEDSAQSAEETTDAGETAEPEPAPQPVGNPYEGETLEILIPFSEDAGIDAWGRAIAPFLEKHLADDAGVVVYNDGGRAAAVSLFENDTDHDGLTVFISSDSISIPFLLDAEEADYDYADFIGVIGSPVGGLVYASPDTGLASADDLCNYTGELSMGTTTLLSLDAAPVLALDLLGIEPEITDGLEGPDAIRGDFEDGDFTLSYDTSVAKDAVETLVEEEDAIALFTLGTPQADGSLGPDPAWPGLPTVAEVYQSCTGSAPSGDAWAAYQMLNTAGFAAQDNIWVHADAPVQHIEALQAAAAEMLNDDEFQTLAAELIGDYEFIAGTDLDAQFQSVSRPSAEAKAFLCDFLQTKHEIDDICGG